MRRADMIPLGIVLCLGGFVATLAVRAPHPRRAASAGAGAAPADSSASQGAGEPSTATVDAALPPPVRDSAAIRHWLRELGPQSYLDDLLRQDDSVLYRWPERAEPLRVWIQPSSEVDGWQPGYVSDVRSAFQEWETLGLPLHFRFVDDSAQGEVHVLWRATLADGHVRLDARSQRIGVTRRTADSNGWIVAASIEIALHGGGNEPLPEEVVRATARHEVGHLIGLTHSRQPTDLMYPLAKALDFSARDRATAQLLYELPPGRLRP